MNLALGRFLATTKEGAIQDLATAYVYRQHVRPPKTAARLPWGCGFSYGR